ncbi:MAG: class I SAM-dependent methyltransferase [Vitreoscilla sp.]|nr:class I SAM-dependent methyltransferase [Vitreoscilla sp.]
MDDFYDQLAPHYHLIYPDWPASARRQGVQLAGLIERHWPGSRRVLDVACGIGTQSIGLALQGLTVTGSDLSPLAVARATDEATRLHANVIWRVGDMRNALAVNGSGFDTVVCCDNSLPHLQTESDIVLALTQMHACLKVGGGCLISLRDYDTEPRDRHLFKPYGVRETQGGRTVLFQVWDFNDAGTHYDLSFYIVEESAGPATPRVQVLRSRYHAIGTERVMALMREAGFAQVQRLDGVFYQPVLVGTRIA